MNFNNNFYTSKILATELSLLEEYFNNLYPQNRESSPFFSINSIGKSVMDTDILSLRVGNGKTKLLFFASIHANELITTNLLLAYTFDYIKNNSNLFTNYTLFIVPLVNPDGCDLFLDALPHNSKHYVSCKDISSKFTSIPFPSGWKSNISGVDLNLQFPALWKNAKKIKGAQGYTIPAPRDFVGIAPLSEPESLALYNLSMKERFDASVCLHTQGDEIYYEFQRATPPGSKSIGLRMSKASNYALKTVPYNSSFAGYKDWFIDTFNKPSFTIELGLGQNPLPLSDFDTIYPKLSKMLFELIYNIKKAKEFL